MDVFGNNMDVFGKENSILNRFLFPSPKPSYSWASFDGELMCIVGRQGNVVPCTVMPGMSTKQKDPTKPFLFDDPASCIVIYCHANGEDIGVLYEAGHWLCDTLGVHVLIPEYPGYGVAPGSPNEISVNQNIMATYEFAVHGLQWDPKRVLFFGRSIGTGPAIKLASEVECGGLILVSPYTSVKDIVSQHAGLVTSWLTAELANIYPSDTRVAQVNCGTLIVHGATDKVIPCNHARVLYKNSAAEHKRLVILEGVGHHGIDLHFAVAHECPALFKLDDKPRYMDIDGFLADPGVQGDTVAAPVPVFDCRSFTWSRPTLERGKTPYLREPPPGSNASATPPAYQYAPPFPEGHPGYDNMNVNGEMITGFIVTDDVLLAHVKAEVQEEHDQFVKARKSPADSQPGPAAKGVGQTNLLFQSFNDNLFPSQMPGHEIAENHLDEVELRTDQFGKVVPRTAGPPTGPGFSTGDPKLFVY